MKITGGKSRSPRMVLVIDDDPEFLQMVRMMLNRRGHSVLTAMDVCEAEEMWTMARDKIDLVVSDHMLGWDRGADLVQRFRRQKPKMNIVLCSGGPLEQEVPGIRFLMKPFKLEKLLEEKN
jgi:DNA-binding NtrC family response regulator